ncbi:MAG: hypothetical protein AB7U49_04255 [Hyphomicrobiaceae bacterium]
MKIWNLITAINWRLVTAALFGIAILHLVATLAAPSITGVTALDHFKAALPLNRIAILPPVPDRQPLLFMNPALRYAACRFDTRTGEVEVAVVLAHPGSSLTVYSLDGDVLFSAAASAEAIAQRVRLIPPDGRFLGLTPESRGLISREVPSATVPAESGIALVALPERGVAYEAEDGRALRDVTCGPHKAPAIAHR